MRPLFSAGKLSFFAVSCAACAAFAGLPASDLILNSRRPDSAAFLPTAYYKRVSVPEESAYFQVCAYSMKLSFNRALHAQVTVETVETDLKEYGFTLYHGHKIKSVTDENNNPLRYTQSADFLTVHSDGGAPLSFITFVYSGYSPTFYSNTQGVFLPGYFAYYPIPGYNVIFTASSSAYSHYKRTVLPQAVKFTLSIDAGGEYFTNLDETGGNEFSGTACGLTVLSGFYKSTQVGGTRIVYPYYKISDSAVRDFYSSFLSDKDYKTVMCVPRVNINYYLSCAALGDCLLAPEDINNVQEQYVMRDIQPQKLSLYYAADNYLHDSAAYSEELERQRRFNNSDAAIVLFDSALNSLPDEAVLQMCSEYIHDDSDSREPKDFFLSLISSTQSRAE